MNGDYSRDGLRWVNACDLFSRFRFHEFIVDKDPCRLLILSTVWSGKFNREIGHGEIAGWRSWRREN